MSMSASFADRPPPDPERFLAALAEFRTGEVSAGTTTQALKRAGLDEFLTQTVAGLQQAGADATTAAKILDAWNRWERGENRPEVALQELDEAGFVPMLEAARDAQREAFG